MLTKLFRAFFATAMLAAAADVTTASNSNARASALFAPALVVTNEAGTPIPLFSLQAYGAEFRYLREVLHQTDLKAPPVETDGWTRNIAEAEWPLMAFAYFGYACANLAAVDDKLRRETLEEMRWLIAGLQTPRMSGFMTEHFGPPFGPARTNVSVFVHGHFLNLCLRYREVSGDTRFDGIIRQLSAELVQAFNASETGILKSYRTMWWLSDNLPALSALVRYDRQFKQDTRSAREKFLRTVKQHFLDTSTGLMATYVDAGERRIVQGPRGISTMYGLHFLRDVSSEFAADQYRRAREHLIRQAFGFAAVREFPAGISGQGDIDSGPLVLGFGPSASGFAIAAAAVMEDEATTKALLQASALAGLPEYKSGALHYTAMPPVGQAVILFGKTHLIRSASKVKTGARP